MLVATDRPATDPRDKPEDDGVEGCPFIPYAIVLSSMRRVRPEVESGMIRPDWIAA
jgi:hypothetical protein